MHNVKIARKNSQTLKSNQKFIWGLSEFINQVHVETVSGVYRIWWFCLQLRLIY